jgi:hypothetical protein
MDETVLCPNCSKTLQPNAKFCSHCGASIAAARSDLQTIAAAAEEKSADGVSVEQPEIQMAASVKRAAEQVRHVSQWGQRIWDIITMSGCGTLSGAWYWYSGMAETQPDYKTCTAIVVLPLLLIVFRKAIDRLLMPIQKIRTRIPPLVRLGIGLAMPFLVSNYLYAKGFTQFDFMFKTLVISTLSSYVIMRNPTIPSVTLFTGDSQ